MTAMPFSVIALVVVVVFLIYKFLVYPKLISPLASIPNAHATTPFSPVWILWARYKHRANSTIHAAHLKHGPIVRLAPNELSVNCVEGGIRTVYAGGWEKHEWYRAQFENYGAPNMFATLANRPHSQRKRLLSHVYSKSNLHASEDLACIAQTLLYGRLLPLLNAAALEGPVDIYMLVNAATMDFITAYIFGLKASTNHLQDAEQNRKWLHWYGHREEGRFWQAELPHLTSILERFGVGVATEEPRQMGDLIGAYGSKMCSKADRTLIEGREKREEGRLEAGMMPVVYARLKDTLGKDGEVTAGRLRPDLSVELEIASEVMDHLAAGFETSGITLTYLAWEVSRHPAVQSRLRAELRSISNPIVFSRLRSSNTVLPPFPTLDALPFLHAVIMETLRLHQAIPGSEPRVSPADGSGVLVGGHRVPAGVRVSAQAYSLHRNPDAFPRPEEWCPERWLEDEGGPLGLIGSGKKGRWFWAFGSGGRRCVGSNFAMLVMKLIVAAVWTSFETSIVDDTDIEQEDAYTANPKGRRLMLQLAPVEKASS